MNPILSIAAIFSFRMFGLFMLIPVFTLYASNIEGAGPKTVGIALGAYGLSQGLLQIPFGFLSDHYGRKKMIAIGLLFFAAGSLLGAFSSNITMLICARVLQGAGAIGSVLIALLADLTPVERRSRAMAVIGATIGLSFAISMFLSSIITKSYGLSGIFYLTFFFSLLGLIVLYLGIPAEASFAGPKGKPEWRLNIRKLLSDSNLLCLNAGIFFQHLIFTASFFAIPLLLRNLQQSESTGPVWHFYLPILIGSFVLALPFIALAERKKQVRSFFIIAVILMLISQFLLLFVSESLVLFGAVLFLYFSSFNYLEANLPSLISRFAPRESKGAAMGIYSSFQFLGIFAGGALAGILFQYFSCRGIFLFNLLVAIFWCGINFLLNFQTLEINSTKAAANPTYK